MYIYIYMYIGIDVCMYIYIRMYIEYMSHRQYSVNKNVSIYVAFVFGSPLRFTVFWQCRSLVVQLEYWNGRPRRLAGFSFSGSTT